MPNLDTITRFGACPRCGRTGTDEDGDSESGYELKEYRGQYLCTICIFELQDHETDNIRNEHDASDQQFLDAAGVRREPE